LMKMRHQSIVTVRPAVTTCFRVAFS